MATAVKMPQLGMTMTEAKLVRWLKREGDTVTKGEPVAEIETDKLNAEVEANTDGILRRLVATEGDVIPVLGVLAVLGAADDTAAAIEAAAASGGKSASTVKSTSASLPAPQAVAATVPAPGATEVRASPIAKKLAADLGVDLSALSGSGPSGRIVEADVRGASQAGDGQISPSTNSYVRASPLAKRLAKEHGLDLHAVRASGPDGRIVERDVLAAAEAKQSQPAAPRFDMPGSITQAPAGLTARETVPMTGMRRVIAERMWASLAQMAQLTLNTEADATALVELRAHLVPAAKVFGLRSPTYTDLIVKIVARVLGQHPLLNASLLGDTQSGEVVCWNEINIGVAVALERGLVVPVIRDAGQKPLQAVSQELAELAERARANRLTPDEMQGGTFTVTNLGLQEVDAFTPVINPPQAAILGIGRIVQKPAVHEGQLAIRHMVTLSLSFDHRVVDGAPAGNFLRDVKRAIEAGTLEV